MTAKDVLYAAIYSQTLDISKACRDRNPRARIYLPATYTIRVLCVFCGYLQIASCDVQCR